MADRPIIFGAPMMRALLNGEKSQTRRYARLSPCCAIGDRLWVREAWACLGMKPSQADGAIYRVGHPEARARGPRVDARWRPSIHMPRWASRMTLVVTDVRSQRLQEISRDDAIAEGIRRVGGSALRWEAWSGAEGQESATPVEAFAVLWDSIHGPGAWSANERVWAITFEVRHGNIDAPEVADG